MPNRLFFGAACACLLVSCSPRPDDVSMASEAAPTLSGPAADETVGRDDGARPELAAAAPKVFLDDQPALETRPDDADANAVLHAPDAPAPPALPAASGDPVPLKLLMGDVAASDPIFAKVPAKYASGVRHGHKDAVASLVRMFDAAKADGVELKVVSGFRSFSDQTRIWEDKWTGKTLVEGGKLPSTVPDPRERALKILEFSSMPGTSRHHWGTDFDLNALTNAYFDSGKGKAIHDWLKENAAEYGFCQVYSESGPDRPRGYSEERWHWSYMPVAETYLAQYPDAVGYDRLTGFVGSEAARDIDVIASYVQGIDPECR
ncbi:MAG: M15 family metallopeptidase [Alphaproteobacteria bacterium]|nr:M15 family metallopeptidase [Alphaproteobacteria bacterium]